MRRRLGLSLCLGLALLPAAACVAQSAPPISEQDLADDRKAGSALARAEDRAEKTWSRASASRRKRIIKDLGSLRPKDRFRALDAIARGGAAFTPLLAEALSSRNGYQVRYALAALGGLRDPAAASPLRAFLKREDISEADRFYAVGALAPIAPKEAAADLWPLFFRDEARLSRAAELGLMRALGSSYSAELRARREQSADKVDRALERLSAQEGGAEGAAPCPPPKTRVIHGEGYRCITDLEDEDAVRRLAIPLARARDAFQRWLAPRDRSRLVTTLRLFRRRRDFERYGAAREFNFVHFSGYYYSSLLREVVAFQQADAAKQARGLRHEAGHDALEQLIGRPPPWFGEGLCEMFEVAAPDEDGAPPVNPEWLPILRGALDAGELPRLEELIGLENSEFYAASSQARYAAAWSFCRFLIVVHGKRGLGLLRTIFRKIEAGGATKAAEAFRGWASLDKLEPAWIAHIKSLA